MKERADDTLSDRQAWWNVSSDTNKTRGIDAKRAFSVNGSVVRCKGSMWAHKLNIPGVTMTEKLEEELDQLWL